MIDTDKYEGAEEVYLCEEMWKGWTDVISKETNQPIARIYCADTVRSHSPTPAHHTLMDAFKLYREVKRLRRAWQILRSRTEMSCICFTEYPDKQDINTHELMDLAMKEAIE